MRGQLAQIFGLLTTFEYYAIVSFTIRPGERFPLTFEGEVKTLRKPKGKRMSSPAAAGRKAVAINTPGGDGSRHGFGCGGFFFLYYVIF